MNFRGSVVYNIVILLFTASHVNAEYNPPIYLYSQGGTQGIGIGYGMKVNPSWAIRAEVNGFNYTKNKTTNGLQSKEKRSVRNAGVYVDYFPTETSFRLTGGLMYNQGKARFDATAPSPDGANLTLNNTVYHLIQGETVSSEVKTSPVMPYFGIGFGHDDIEPVGFNFHADLGLGFGKKPETQLTVNAPSLADDTTLETNRQAQEQKIQKDMKTFRFVPVLKLGIGYTW